MATAAVVRAPVETYSDGVRHVVVLDPGGRSVPARYNTLAGIWLPDG